jgi:hypothetical protein
MMQCCRASDLRPTTKFELVDREIQTVLAEMRRVDEEENDGEEGDLASLRRGRKTSKRPRARSSQSTVISIPRALFNSASPTSVITIPSVVARQAAATHATTAVVARAPAQPASTVTSDVSLGTAILTFALYAPTSPVQCMTLEALATQTLADVVDAFECELAPSGGQRVACNQCVYVEGVFYDDTRHADAVRHSSEWRAWLRRVRARVPLDVDLVSPHDTPPQSLHTTPLRALIVRLHAPYLYVHGGACAHVFALTALRSATSRDVRTAASYVRVLQHKPPPRRLCCVCARRVAHYVVYNDALAPTSPALFCALCYQVGSDARACESDAGSEARVPSDCITISSTAYCLTTPTSTALSVRDTRRG